MSGQEQKFNGIICHPITINGDPFDSACALDIHTIKSIPIDQWHFDTTYSDIGKLVFELKNRAKNENADVIGGAIAEFVWSNVADPIDCVIAVPPSHKRSFQPVLAIAAVVAKTLGVTDCSDLVKKIKDTKPLKDLFDSSERKKELAGAFVASEELKGKVVLLVDDLFRSGETASEVCRAIKAVGATSVHLVTATKTRVHR